MTDNDKKALAQAMAQLVTMMRAWRSAVMTNDQASCLTAAHNAWALLLEIDDLTINIERDEATIQ